MNNLMIALYKRYGDFNYAYGVPLTIETAIKIYKNGIENIDMLESVILSNETKKVREKTQEDYNELVEELKALQPNSFSLQLMYIWLLLESMEEKYFTYIGISRLEIYRLILSITFYLIFLQTYLFSDLPMSKSSSNSIFGRQDFLLGIDDLKKVCWSITENGYEKFCNLFAHDIHENDIETLKDVHLFLDGQNIFIFWINDFLEYILLEIEKKYREWSVSEVYSSEKGIGFEDIVYGFTSQFYKNTIKNVFYKEENKKSEIDTIFQDNKHMIAIECKSGTIDLKNAKNDEEIVRKLNFKLKKAYKTLDRLSNYISSTDKFIFEDKKNNIVMEGRVKDFDFVFLHISMYPIDALSSSVHILNDKYYLDTEIPKMTISFEHFLAICVDCHERRYPIGEYFIKRRKLLESHPQMKFDNNELDLYHQLTNKSLLRESIDKGILGQVNPNTKIITTFKDQHGKETRPASRLLLQLENRLFQMQLEISKSSFGLNNRFIKHMKRNLIKKL